MDNLNKIIHFFTTDVKINKKHDRIFEDMLNMT